MKSIADMSIAEYVAYLRRKENSNAPQLTIGAVLESKHRPTIGQTVAGIGPGGWDSSKLAQSQLDHAAIVVNTPSPYKVANRSQSELLAATYVLADYFIKRGDHVGLSTVHAMRKAVGL